MLLLLLLFYIYYAHLTRLCVPNPIMVPSISVFVAQPHFQYSGSMVLCAETQVGAPASLLCRATTSLVFSEHDFMHETPDWCPSITFMSRNHISGIQGAWVYARNPRLVPQHHLYVAQPHLWYLCAKPQIGAPASLLCRATTLFHTLFFLFFFFVNFLYVTIPSLVLHLLSTLNMTSCTQPYNGAPASVFLSRNHTSSIHGAWFYARNPRLVP